MSEAFGPPPADGLTVHAGRPTEPAIEPQFRDANLNRRVPKEELFAKALELAFRFDIAGPIVPYGHTLVPPGSLKTRRRAIQAICTLRTSGCCPA